MVRSNQNVQQAVAEVDDQRKSDAGRKNMQGVQPKKAVAKPAQQKADAQSKAKPKTRVRPPG